MSLNTRVIQLPHVILPPLVILNASEESRPPLPHQPRRAPARALNPTYSSGARRERG